MKIDKFGVLCFSFNEIIDTLYQGKIESVPNMVFEQCKEIKEYNDSAKSLGTDQLRLYQPQDCTIEEFDSNLQSIWFIPEEYKNKDILTYCLSLCENKDQEERVKEEYEEFKKRDMIPLLQFLLYLVEFMRKEKIIWGVGRGSSVASFVLFLIGIHKINPIQYNLDWKEFLR